MIHPLSPLEYDPESGEDRPSVFSRPSTMMWGLVLGFAAFGFASWVMWPVAGVLAAVLVLTQLWLKRRRRAAVTPEDAAAARAAKRA